MDSFADGRPVLVYGTGKIASDLLRAYPSMKVIGVLDQIQLDGTFEGYPILMWTDLVPGMADAIVIASSKIHIREIYFRIVHQCAALGLSVYDFTGMDLCDRYRLEFPWVEAGNYFLKTEDTLKAEIAAHEVISFDLFDTLIMRNTLYPTDIFDLVEARVLEKYGIAIPNFRKKHRRADLESCGGNIYAIYDLLAEIYHWDTETRKIVMQEELLCEKENLFSRKKMVQLLDWAALTGKRIFIVTDMYLPEAILRDILDSLGISKYEKIFVSCDAGVDKGHGLFTRFKQAARGQKILHIGDNSFSDGECAEKAGLDTFLIKSAVDILAISSIHKMLNCTKNLGDRLYIGRFISRIFNDPFCLSGSNGLVPIRTLCDFHYMCTVPLAIVYMRELYRLLGKEKFQSVIFVARDGYLFYRLWKSGILRIGEDSETKAYYLPCSRRQSWRSALTNDEALDEFLQFCSSEYAHPWKTVEMMFSDAAVFRWKDLSISAFQEEVRKHKQAIFQKAEISKGYFQSYLRSEGVHGRLLFCDLNSQGTIQSALCKIFDHTVEGYYLQWVSGRLNRNIPHYSSYDNSDAIGEYTQLLELIFTSPAPSAADIDAEGHVIYAPETRGEEELRFVKLSHDVILREIESYIGAFGNAADVSTDLAKIMLTMVSNTVFQGDADLINHLYAHNDMSNEKQKAIQHF